MLRYLCRPSDGCNIMSSHCFTFRCVRRIAVVIGLTMAACVPCSVLASPVSAATLVHCPYPNRDYAILAPTSNDNPYGAWYGMSANWNRAYMSTTGTVNAGHLTSEMWLLDTYLAGYPWVEVGLESAYDPDIGQGAYFFFWAYELNGVFQEPNRLLTSPTGVTDDYELQWSGSGTSWQASIDSSVFYSPNLGWTIADLPNLGAECNATSAEANTFNMYSSLIDTSWNIDGWTYQSAFFQPNPPTLYNGISYSNGEWSWNTK